MPEVYTSTEATLELLDPITGAVLSTAILYRRDLSISERPVYAQRGYHRSNTLSAAHLRSLGTVTLRKDADSLALAQEIKRWQKGIVFYALSSDLKGKRYRHPHLRVTFNNADGTKDVQTAYAVKLSDRTVSAPDGSIVSDTITLDALGGIDNPSFEAFEPIRGLSLHRTGTATHLSTSGTLTTAGDGVARIGLPGAVARRNLFADSQNLGSSSWTRNAVSVSYVDADGQQITTTNNFANVYQILSVTPGAVLTLSWYAKRGTMTDMKYAISNVNTGTNIIAPTSYFAQTNASTYSRISVTFTVPAGCTQVQLQPLRDSLAQGTCYIGRPQIEVGSLTPYQPTNATGVDPTHPLNGAGLVLEGAGKNWLNNPSLGSPSGGLAAGWVTGGAGTLSCSNGEQTFTATAQWGAVSQNYAFGSDASNITLSAEIKGDGGIVDPYFYDASGNFLGGATSAEIGAADANGFRRYVAKANYSNIRTVNFRIADNRASGWTPITFKRPQLENNPFPTSWVDGTRNADLCGIVPPHNLLKWSEGFDNAVWSKTGGATITGTNAWNGSGFVLQDSGVIAGTKTVTLAVTLSVTSGAATCKLYLDTPTASAITSQTLTVSTTPQTFLLTGKFASSDLSTIRAGVYSGSGAIILGKAQLVEGYHPGPYVRTTDTAIPAPVSPALDPAWSQNGRVTFKVMPPPISTGKDYAIIGNLGTSGNRPFQLWRYSATLANDARIYFDRKPADGSLTSGQISTTTSIYDGAVHEAALEWRNYEATDPQTGQWRRFMPMSLYIDANDGQGLKLVAEQDVAALYGATAWATIDPSRLVSDGNVFAVLQDVIPTWPTLPSGAIPAL